MRLDSNAPLSLFRSDFYKNLRCSGGGGIAIRRHREFVGSTSHLEFFSANDLVDLDRRKAWRQIINPLQIGPSVKSNERPMKDSSSETKAAPNAETVEHADK
jgi:hypothetical protein